MKPNQNVLPCLVKYRYFYSLCCYLINRLFFLRAIFSLQEDIPATFFTYKGIIIHLVLKLALPESFLCPIHRDLHSWNKILSSASCVGPQPP